jgi:hypothetical protein
MTSAASQNEWRHQPIAELSKNRYMQAHGIQIRMHEPVYRRAAGPQASAGTLFRAGLRRAQQPPILSLAGFRSRFGCLFPIFSISDG